MHSDEPSMLPEVGIVLTLGTADIERCHWIKDMRDELEIKGEGFMTLKKDFGPDDIVKKVREYSGYKPVKL